MTERDAAADVGLHALELVLDSLQPDAQWTTRHERAFSWIPHRLTQTITASPVFVDGEVTLSRLTARTVVAESVTAPDEDVLRVLSLLNRHALGSAYTYEKEARRIEATTVAFVHEATVGWRALQFSGFAILQLGLAHSEARYIADRCGAAVASAAGERGLPETPDAFVGSIDEQWARTGRAPSPFADGAEFQAIEQIVSQGMRAATHGASREGIAIELPFADETSFARLDTRERHRRIGNGLRVRLFLPIDGTDVEQQRRADALNRAEAAGESATAHYGAWCLDVGADGSREAPLLQYQMFLPSGFHRPGVSQDALFSTVRRAQWADALHAAGSREQ
jgi:hypothetical protein